MAEMHKKRSEKMLYKACYPWVKTALHTINPALLDTANLRGMVFVNGYLVITVPGACVVTPNLFDPRYYKHVRDFQHIRNINRRISPNGWYSLMGDTPFET